MNYSRRVDELQQRVAAIKAAVQAAAAEFREQLRRRDLAGIVITSGQDGRFRTVRASTSSQ
jgi:Ribonuclease G/E